MSNLHRFSLTDSARPFHHRYSGSLRRRRGSWPNRWPRSVTTETWNCTKKRPSAAFTSMDCSVPRSRFFLFTTCLEWGDRSTRKRSGRAI